MLGAEGSVKALAGLGRAPTSISTGGENGHCRHSSICNEMLRMSACPLTLGPPCLPKSPFGGGQSVSLPDPVKKHLPTFESVSQPLFALYPPKCQRLEVVDARSSVGLRGI